MRVLTAGPREKSMQVKSGEGNQGNEILLVPLLTRLLMTSLWMQETDTEAKEKQRLFCHSRLPQVYLKDVLDLEFEFLHMDPNMTQERLAVRLTQITLFLCIKMEAIS